MHVIFGRESVRLPKIGHVTYKKHCKMRGQLKTVTVKREGDRWYVCASSEVEIKDPVPVNDQAIGVDFGIRGCDSGKKGRPSGSAAT
jgi:putative transposase